MKKAATLSSKNQITVPASVRKALGLRPGESIVFEIDMDSETPEVKLRRSPTLEEMAGSVPVPDDARGLSWEQIRDRAWSHLDNEQR